MTWWNIADRLSGPGQRTEVFCFLSVEYIQKNNWTTTIGTETTIAPNWPLLCTQKGRQAVWKRTFDERERERGGVRWLRYKPPQPTAMTHHRVYICVGGWNEGAKSPTIPPLNPHVLLTIIWTFNWRKHRHWFWTCQAWNSDRFLSDEFFSKNILPMPMA